MIMPSRIMHLPYNQGNFVPFMQQAEQGLNASSLSAAFTNPFAAPANINLSETRWGVKNKLNTFLRACKSDIIVFNYGTSLFDTPSRRAFLLDLPLYPKSIKTAMIFQGSDARIDYADTIRQSRAYEISLGHKVNHSTNDGIIHPDEIDLKRKKIAKIDRHIDRLFFFNPDLAKALPDRARFLPYPYSLNPHLEENPTLGENPAEKVLSAGPNKRPIRVLHLSTNRILKGTGLIEKAIKTAQTSVNFDAKICVRVPRAEANSAIDWADIFIDQVGLGWYGIQAVEALAKGKIVFCALDPTHWQQYMPDYVHRPSGIVNVTPETLASKLVEIISDPKTRLELSKAGPQFVKQIHDPIKIVKSAYGDWINGD